VDGKPVRRDHPLSVDELDSPAADFAVEEVLDAVFLMRVAVASRGFGPQAAGAKDG
jgi:hypothetical protein